MTLKKEPDTKSEKLEWLHQEGIREFKNPMKYYDSNGNLYSEEYIRKTPLVVLMNDLAKPAKLNRERMQVQIEYELGEFGDAVKKLVSDIVELNDSLSAKVEFLNYNKSLTNFNLGGLTGE